MDLLLKVGRSGGSSGGGGGGYDPSSFFPGGTKGMWLDSGNTAKILNASAASAVNTDPVATANDSGTAGYSLVQSTNANRPILVTNHVNGRSALSLDLTDYFDCTGMNAFLSGANNVTLMAVFRHTDASTNHIMFRQYDNPFSNERVRFGYAGDKPRLLFNKDAGSYGNDRIGASGIANATYHAVIYVVDAQNGLDGAYVDNGTYLAFTGAGGTTAASAFDATTANQSRFFLNCLGYVADLYIHKNSLLDSTQRAAWFAAVKTRFALTGY